MRAGEEFELKLRIDPGAADSLRRSAWWRALGKGRGRRLHSVYYDTRDGTLRKHGLSLRIRSSGSRFVQTLKLTGHEFGPLVRREWETLMPDAVPDPALVIDPSLPPAYRALTSSDLRPVFDVDVRRDTRRLDADEAQIEVVIDEGDVTAGARSAPVREVEMELVGGKPGGLFSQARRLSDAACARLHMRAKSDIGYGLLGGDDAVWSRAPGLKLDRAMSAGAALRAIVGNCLRHLTANDDCARLNAHIEGVHQCRVALRRLRSAFKIYRDVLDARASARLIEETRWLAGVLGRARDLDVLRADLLEPAGRALEDPRQMAPLFPRLERQKADAYAGVAEALCSQRYSHLLLDLAEFARYGDLRARKGAPAGQSLDMPLARFAANALGRAHKRVLKRGRKFKRLSVEDRHRVRLAVKDMRYVTEFFGGLFAGKAHKRFVRRLARLQEDLGRMNDVEIAAHSLHKLTGARAGEPEDGAQGPVSGGDLAFAAGCVLGWHRHRAAEIDGVLVEDWHAFAEAKPFWAKAA